ncbi:hypothetical protein [Blastopirellula marina]|nr:hypothetical protein [Blastopirellula marina]
MENLASYTQDTSSEAEAVQRELMAQMQPSQRMALALRLSSEMLRLSKAAIRRRFPQFNEAEVGLKFIELHYGAELAEAVRRSRSNVQS